jgi:hypothetical protein
MAQQAGFSRLHSNQIGIVFEVTLGRPLRRTPVTFCRFDQSMAPGVRP